MSKKIGWTKLPDFQELREKYSALSDEQIQSAAKECVETAAEYFYNEFYKGLLKHKRTGAAIRTLKKSAISETLKGKYEAEAGCLDTTDREGFMHTVWQEYGGGHFKADPWHRPVVDRGKTKLKKEFEKIFEKHTGGEFK